MDLTTREFQAIKIKSILKNNKIGFVCQSNSEVASEWLTLEQAVYFVNLAYYKLNTPASQKVIFMSTFRLSSLLVSSAIALLTQKSTLIRIDVNAIAYIYKAFKFLAIKINATLYSIIQFKKMYIFLYLGITLISYNFMLAVLKIR